MYALKYLKFVIILFAVLSAGCRDQIIIKVDEEPEELETLAKGLFLSGEPEKLNMVVKDQDRF